MQRSAILVGRCPGRGAPVKEDWPERAGTYCSRRVRMGWKNYELTGNASGTSTLAEDRIETRVEREWFTPTVARSDLKRLMRRADSPAIWNFALWIGLMALFASLTVATWESGWGIFWLIVYSTVHQSATARQHELGLGTPFRTRWLNDALFHHSSRFRKATTTAGGIPGITPTRSLSERTRKSRRHGRRDWFSWS